MTFPQQPPRPRQGGRPRSRLPIPREMIDAEKWALAAGKRFGQRIIDLEAGKRRRAMQSQYRGIPPRWYQEIEKARKERNGQASS